MQRHLWILLGGIALSMQMVYAQETTTPPPGAPLRKTLMDALRGPMEKELKQSVVFTVGTLKATENWAFGLLTPTQPTGKAIDYRNTPYWEAVKAGAFDDGICVLWQRKQDIWTVRVYILGATDVPYGCWWKEFGVPKSVLPYAEKDCSYVKKQP